MSPRNHANFAAVLSGESVTFRTLLAQFGLTPKSTRGLAASEAVAAEIAGAGVGARWQIAFPGAGPEVTTLEVVVQELVPVLLKRRGIHLTTCVCLRRPRSRSASAGGPNACKGQRARRL